MGKKKLLIVLFLLCFLVALCIIATYVFIKYQGDSQRSFSKPSVVVSFYPLYYFASRIGGNDISLSLIVPSGAEPHEYEPTPQQRVLMEKSSLLILNGAKLEPWGEKIASDLRKENKMVISVADSLELKPLSEENGAKDPHIWLSPHYSRQIAEQILQAFVTIDGKHKAEYTKNAKQLFAEFDQIDGEFHEGLEQCSIRDFITAHAAFGYLAEEYELHQYAIQISPDQEPSAAAMTSLIDYARSHQTKYVFFETLISPKLSETIAKEVGAKTLVLDPIEGVSEQDMVNGKTYFSIMRENLNNLRTALQCH